MSHARSFLPVIQFGVTKSSCGFFKGLDIGEYSGSGIPCILKAYPRESFIFTANFIRTVFPMDSGALELEQNALTT